MNGFRAPHCRSRPPHLHRRVCASAASLPRGPTWPHSVGASSVLSSDPWGCALVRLAFPARLAPAPLPFAAFCAPMLLGAGPGGAPVPPAWACPSVRGSRAGYLAYTATPRGVKVRVPRPSPMCPAGVLSPTFGPPGPRGRSPQQNFGAARCIPRGWSVGDLLASPWEETVGRPGVIALHLPHLVEFRCHCPSPHAQHTRRPVRTWDSQVAQ